MSVLFDPWLLEGSYGMKQGGQRRIGRNGVKLRQDRNGRLNSVHRRPGRAKEVKIKQIPAISHDLEEEAKHFNDIWNFANCVGVLDGKESLYFNYKATYSIVLMGLVFAVRGWMWDIMDIFRMEGFSRTVYCRQLWKTQLWNIARSKPLPKQSNLT